MPLISVILPTYNRLSWLSDSINSVLAQTYRNFELIIVDDGSTDKTREWLRNSFTQEIYSQQIKLILQDNQGVSAARKTGVDNSKGDWLAFIDSDDIWFKDKLQIQMDLAREKPQLPLIHGEEIWVRNGVRVNQMKKHAKSGGRIFKKCVDLCCISPSTSLIKKNTYLEFGGFSLDFPVCEDYDLWLKICATHEVGFVTTPVIQKNGGHEDQLSHQYKAMDYFRLKSLMSLRHSPNISEDERIYLYKSAIKRTQLLLRGYKKHQNLKNHDEVHSIQLILEKEFTSFTL